MKISEKITDEELQILGLLFARTMEDYGLGESSIKLIEYWKKLCLRHADPLNTEDFGTLALQVCQGEQLRRLLPDFINKYYVRKPL